MERGHRPCGKKLRMLLAEGEVANNGLRSVGLV